MCKYVTKMSDRVSKTERLAKECEMWRDSISTLAELNKLSFVRIEGQMVLCSEG